MSQHPSPLNIAIAIELHYALPWHHDTLDGIMRYARERGWACQVDPFLAGPEGHGELSDYDGVVGRLNDELLSLAASNDLPNVNLLQTHAIPGRGAIVALDLYASGRLAIRHLIDCGYRRFACLTDGQTQPTQRLLAGMHDEAIAHGFAPPKHVAIPSYIERDRPTNKHIRGLLADVARELDKPVGVVVRNAAIARYFAQTCQSLAFQVPQALGIVTIDGDHVIVNNASPTLSALDLDFYRQGYEAAAALDQLMQGQGVHPAKRLIAPQGVITRQSTDVFICPDALVSLAMRFIAEHVRQNLTVDQIAAHAQVSERTLRRRFEEAMGHSVYDQVQRQRVGYCQRLLSETDRPINDIAADCGFSSTSHFARTFKKAKGLTPSAYRKSTRKSEDAVKR